MGHSTQNAHLITQTFVLPGLGTAAGRGVCCPVVGKITHIGLGIYTAVDGTNVITTSINGTAVTDGAITLTAANTVNSTAQAHPTAANTVKKGDYIYVATDGGGTVGDVIVTISIDMQG